MSDKPSRGRSRRARTGARRNTNRLMVLRAEMGERLNLGRPVSQVQTAIESGVAEHRYWRLERGYAAPTDDEQSLLAKYFRKSVPEIFTTIGGKTVEAVR